MPFRSSGEDTLLDVILNEQIYRTHLRVTNRKEALSP